MSRWSEGLRDVISGVIHYPHSFYDLFTPLPTITLKAIMATSHELSIPSVLLLQKNPRNGQQSPEVGSGQWCHLTIVGQSQHYSLRNDYHNNVLKSSPLD